MGRNISNDRLNKIISESIQEVIAQNGDALTQEKVNDTNKIGQYINAAIALCGKYNYAQLSNILTKAYTEWSRSCRTIDYATTKRQPGM